MRRGPAIGGHLPRVSRTVLEHMTPHQRWEYHSRRRDVFEARTDFFAKLALVTGGMAVVCLLISLVLRLAG